MTDAINNASVSLAAIAAATVTETAMPFANVDDITLSGEMVVSAKAMAVCLDTAEGEVSGHAKAYGQRRAVLQFNRNVAAGSLDAADKAAIGYKDLAANSAAKRRLSQWHSRFRLIAERWDAMSETDKADLLQGRASFLSLYDKMQKADRDAKKEADKAATEAAAAITNASGEATSPSRSFDDILSELVERYSALTTAEEIAAVDATIAGALDLINAHALTVNGIVADEADIAKAA